MEGDCTAGYTGSYIKVYCAGDLRGKICNVRLVKPFKDGAFGEVIFKLPRTYAANNAIL